MATIAETKTIDSIREAARPLSGGKEDFDSLLKEIGNAKYALLGEASHGTHEFYKTRAEITKRLIAEKGFNPVGILFPVLDSGRC